MVKVITEEVANCCDCPFVQREGCIDDNDQEYAVYNCEAPGFPDGEIAEEEELALDDGFFSSADDADNKGFDVYEQIHPRCPLPDKEEE